MTAPMPQPVLDIDEARALTARIRARLSAATADLIAAWCGRVWLPLGHASWDAYLEDEFGDLLHVRLPAPVRRERVVEMRNQGMSTRAIAPALGVKKSTIANDLKRPDIAERVKLAEVISLDDRRQPAPKDPARNPDQDPGRTPSSVDRVVATVARRIKRGLDGGNVHEVAKDLHWRQGQTSCALSRAEKRGRLARTGRFRDGCAVYVAPTSPIAAALPEVPGPLAGCR